MIIRAGLTAEDGMGFSTLSNLQIGGFGQSSILLAELDFGVETWQEDFKDKNQRGVFLTVYAGDHNTVDLEANCCAKRLTQASIHAMIE